MRWIISAFIAGELLFLSLSELPSFFWVLVMFLCLASTVFIYAIRHRSFHLDLAIDWVLLALIFSLLGFMWNGFMTRERLLNLLPEEYESVPLLVEGVIDSLPQDSELGRRFTLNVQSWRLLSNSELVMDGGLFPDRISLGWYAPRPFFSTNRSDQKVDLSKIPQLIPGQIWRLPVVLKKPRGLLNPHTFDYERWAFIQNLGANGHVLDKNKVFLLGWTWKNFNGLIDFWRFKIRQKIQQSLGGNARYAGVLVALVIGDQNAISQDDWKIFNATGIAHLIAISGMHITMLAIAGAWLAKRFWRGADLVRALPSQKMAVIAGFLTAFFYSWIAGFQIPAQRTMMMVGVAAIALWTGRVVRGFDLWWWALFMVMLINPYAIYIPGFWLSFGAVAIILFAMPPTKELHTLQMPDADHIYLQSIRKSFWEACRVQAVVTIALIPLTLYWFSQISIVSPLSNAIAIPLVSWVVTPLAMMGAFLPEWVGGLFLAIAHFLLDYLIRLLTLMASWHWALLHGAQPSWPIFLIAMAGVLVCIRPGNILATWKSRLLGLLICLGLFFPLPSGISEGDFQALAWDIGQGTAVLIRTKNHVLLYDAGPVSGASNDPGERVIIPYLRALGVRKIDRLAISHKDADHIGGVGSLLKGMPIDEVRGSIPESHFLQKEFLAAKVNALPCQAGDRWHWDGVEFIVWHPGSEVTFEDHFHRGKPNEMSCVIEVRNQNYSFWLTGDVEKYGEIEIVERLQNAHAEGELLQRKQVLMAPHHGSKTSSTPIFLEFIDPQWAFAQTGYKNRYRHPSEPVIARYESLGLKLLNTSYTGALYWKFEGKKLDIVGERELNRRIWHR
jgi:competence protein ComEC